MPELFASTLVPVDAAVAWRVVRDFGGLPTWQPAVSRSVLRDGDPPDRIGAVRTLTLADGSTVVELLVALDDHARSLTYGILDSPYPVRDYRATLQVAPLTTTGESFVAWSVAFDCDAADADPLTALLHKGVLATGLRGLAERLGAAPTRTSTARLGGSR